MNRSQRESSTKQDPEVAFLPLSQDERKLIEESLVFRRNHLPIYLTCVRDKVSRIEDLLERLRNITPVGDGKA